MRREEMKSSQKGDKCRLLVLEVLFLREITFIRDGLTDEGWRYQICQIVFSQPNSIVQVCRTRREAALCLAFQDLHTQN